MYPRVPWKQKASNLDVHVTGVWTIFEVSRARAQLLMDRKGKHQRGW